MSEGISIPPQATAVDSPVPGRPTSDGRWPQRLLLAAVDLGLVATIFAVPLILGGRIAAGQLVLVTLAAFVAVCWCLRQAVIARAARNWTRSTADWLLPAVLVLVAVQLVPLPPSLLGNLSPNVYETLPLWAPATEAAQTETSATETAKAETSATEAPTTMGTWATLSLTPVATRNALILLLAFVLLFLTTVQRVQRVEDAERIIRWIAVATVVMAAFALLQFLTANGKFFWFYAHPYSDTQKCIQGSFTNRNHFAQFMALGIGPLAWWVFDAVRRKRQKIEAYGRRAAAGADVVIALRAMGLGLCIFAGLLTTSRGGAMAIFLASVVCLLILYRGSLIRPKTLMTAVGIGTLVGAGLFIYGYESLANRLDDFESLDELDKTQGRRKLWKADLVAASKFALTGTGLGSHGEVSPMIVQNEATGRGVEYTHAENGYVQVAMEGGGPGFVLALVAVGLCVFWCVASIGKGTSPRILLCIAAVAPALAANFAHSLTDFVWYVPGCMVVVVLLAACACRVWQLRREQRGTPIRRASLSRIGWAAASICLVFGGYLMADNRFRAARAEPHWNRSLVLRREYAECEPAQRRAALVAIANELAAVVEHQPDHARAHVQLAETHLRLFDLPENTKVTAMGVDQVRDAVLASNFATAAEMHDWLSQAFGRRSGHLTAALHHARRALRSCPLLGEGYVYLADVLFLDGPRRQAKMACIEQAMRVRPFDGAVLFAVGQEAALAGNAEMAFDAWQRSYALGPIHQQRLLDHLAAGVRVAVFIESFPSDREALKLVVRQYREFDRHYRELDGQYGELDPDDERWGDLPYAVGCYAKCCEHDARQDRGQTNAKRWMEAAAAYAELQNLPERLRCLRWAVELRPYFLPSRRALGDCLYQLGEYEEAEEHLKWCLQRRPHDKQLQAQVGKAVDARLRVSARSGPDVHSIPGMH